MGNFSIGEHSSIRRYYIDTSQSINRTPLIPLTQEVTDGLKLYVVARKNYLTYDRPYIAPPLFPNVPQEVVLLPTERLGDFFDRGILSTDDEDETSPPLQSKSRSILHRSNTPNKLFSIKHHKSSEDNLSSIRSRGKRDGASLHHPDSSRRSGARVISSKDLRLYQFNYAQDGHDTLAADVPHEDNDIPIEDDIPPIEDNEFPPEEDNFFLEDVDHPLEDNNFIQDEVEEFRSDRKTPKRQVQKGSSNKTPITSVDKSVKVSIGSARNRKSISKIINSEPSGLYYKLGRDLKNKALSSNNSINGSELSHISLYNPPPIDDTTKKPEVTFDTHDDNEGIDYFEEDELLHETGDNYPDNGEVFEEDGDNKRTSKVYKVRKALSSAALLNSWYIAYGSDRDSGDVNTIDWSLLTEYNKRNSRYPRRSRLPPTQHWSSYRVPDGSSVVFIIGISTSEDDNTTSTGDVPLDKLFDLNEDNTTTFVPNTSLVLMDNKGESHVKLVEDTSDNKLLTLEDKRKPNTTAVTPTATATKKAKSKTKAKKSRNNGLTVEEALEYLKNKPAIYKDDESIQGTSPLLHIEDSSTNQPEVQSNSLSTSRGGYPPEVITSRSPAESSSNYLPVNGIATPGDRGEDEGSDGSRVKDVTSSGKSETIHGSRGEVNREASTASGIKNRTRPRVEPAADLGEAEGELNRRADGRTKPQADNRLHDKVSSKPKKSPKGKKDKVLTVNDALDILNKDDGKQTRRKSIEPNLGLNPDSSLMHEGKLLKYKSVHRPEDVETIVDEGIKFKPMILTSRCRTSNVIIPKNSILDFGNIKSNFICVYLYSGVDIKISGMGKEITVNEKSMFFLPINNVWSIKNNSRVTDAKMVIIFVNV